jgi:hypothetical protein
MIIVKMIGGLGNQMFQYAAARRLAEARKTVLKMDLSYLLDRARRKEFIFRSYSMDIFRCRETFASEKETVRLTERRTSKAAALLSKIITTRSSSPVICEPHFHFYKELLGAPDNVYLDGYWQSEKYFKDIDKIIRDEFTFRAGLSENCKDLAKKIESSNSICLNVRRTDFVTVDSSLQFIGLDYIERGMKKITEMVDHPSFFIFSDDIEWCRENIKHSSPVSFVTHDFAGDRFKDYLQLMILCKHFIIPNSTFGWWAAWLNKNPSKIVIAPKRWFSDPSINTDDLIPEGWVRI